MVKGFAPVLSRLEALEEHAKWSHKPSSGSAALSAQSTGPPKSVPEILAEIQASQAAQAASQAAQAAALAELQGHLDTQKAFFSNRFDDFPGK